MKTGTDDRATAVFEAERPRLTALAYRMTGTPDDADDVVQDAWLRWERADRAAIDEPAAWLTTVTTRLSIDRLTSARARRETYVGPWVPEPLAPGAATVDADLPAMPSDPSDLVTASESLSLGFLRVLETLTPVERAVFLLHDVFGYRFEEIAASVDRSPAATRQIAKRARDRVRDGRPRVEPDPAEARALSDAFLAAVVQGDVDRLTEMLTDDVVFLSDGGKDRHAARRPVVGPDKVARLFVNIARRDLDDSDEMHAVEVNGQRALYIVRAGEPFILLTLGWRHGRLAEAISILEPGKLLRFHERWVRSQS